MNKSLAGDTNLSMSKTETVPTVYGDVEIETVECDSCGQRIAKEDAHDFEMGPREGHACDGCVSDGPVGFPAAEKLKPPNEGFALYVVTGVIALPGAMLITAFSGWDKSEKMERELYGYSLGGYTVLVWSLIVGLLWVVL